MRRGCSSPLPGAEPLIFAAERPAGSVVAVTGFPPVRTGWCEIAAEAAPPGSADGDGDRGEAANDLMVRRCLEGSLRWDG